MYIFFNLILQYCFRGKYIFLIKSLNQMLLKTKFTMKQLDQLSQMCWQDITVLFLHMVKHLQVNYNLLLSNMLLVLLTLKYNFNMILLNIYA